MAKGLNHEKRNRNERAKDQARKNDDVRLAQDLEDVPRVYRHVLDRMVEAVESGKRYEVPKGVPKVRAKMLWSLAYRKAEWEGRAGVSKIIA